MKKNKSNKKLELNGNLLLKIIQGGTKAVENNKYKINKINVFPVPDGDTGTNMTLTLKSVIDSFQNNNQIHAGESSKKMYESALIGARGNSGLILSQFFKGLSQAINNKNFSAQNFIEAFEIAKSSSIEAIPNPTSGTMITIYSDCANKGKELLNKNIIDTLEILAFQAIETVKKTPSMLDILQEANVVDSGAFGLAVMLLGGVDVIKNNGDGNINVDIPNFNPKKTDINEKFFSDINEEIWGYCTVFALTGENLDPENLKIYISNIGKSTIVTGNENIVKVHTHTTDPGKIISYCSSFGVLSNFDIKSMDEQTKEWIAKQKKNIKLKSSGTSIISDAHGKGIIKLMKEIISKNIYVNKVDNSMTIIQNDLLERIEATETNDIIYLPNNNKNYSLFKEITDLTSKNLFVIPSLSLQSGISCLFVFDEKSSTKENVARMNDVLDDIKTGSIEKGLRKSNFIAKFENKEITTGNTPEEALINLIRNVSPENSLVTVYTGIESNKEELEKALKDNFSDLEIEIIEGGQPSYNYLIGIE